MADPDPRVFFAAERTLLAWLRTGLTIAGFGFVVSRFVLFLRVLSVTTGRPMEAHGSATLGAVLVAFGGVVILGAAWQHQRFCQTLASHERPRAYWGGWVIGVCGVSGCATLGLAIYLLVS